MNAIEIVQALEKRIEELDDPRVVFLLLPVDVPAFDRRIANRRIWLADPDEPNSMPSESYIAMVRAIGLFEVFVNDEPFFNFENAADAGIGLDVQGRRPGDDSYNAYYFMHITNDAVEDFWGFSGDSVDEDGERPLCTYYHDEGRYPAVRRESDPFFFHDFLQERITELFDEFIHPLGTPSS